MDTMTVKDSAARKAQDAASHGYNGREGSGAALLKICAKAVRIASRSVERVYSVPTIAADERADYTSELVCRIVGEHHGHLPMAEHLSTGYLVRRAQGIILNDRERQGLDLTQPSSAEAGADPRLDGPLTVPVEVEALADKLPLTQTGRRALVAAMVPATRAEWADYYGYATPNAWHVTANRGRAELYAIGESTIREALAELEDTSIMDGIDADLMQYAEGVL